MSQYWQFYAWWIRRYIAYWLFKWQIDRYFLVDIQLLYFVYKAMCIYWPRQQKTPPHYIYSSKCVIYCNKLTDAFLLIFNYCINVHFIDQSKTKPTPFYLLIKMWKLTKLNVLHATFLLNIFKMLMWLQLQSKIVILRCCARWTSKTFKIKTIWVNVMSDE